MRKETNDLKGMKKESNASHTLMGISLLLAVVFLFLRKDSYTIILLIVGVFFVINKRYWDLKKYILRIAK